MASAWGRSASSATLGPVCLVKTTSSRVSPVGVVAASPPDPEEWLRGEAHVGAEEDERNSGIKTGDRHDRSERESDQPHSTRVRGLGSLSWPCSRMRRSPQAASRHT
jgi:hypothetical protein